MNAPRPARQPHVVLDISSRNSKALKIEHLLGLATRPQPLRMLEVGTGAGGIAHYFGTHPRLCCVVDAVDVVDNRQVFDGYTYRQVRGVALPFDDATFDVVISNHVIEHVGDATAQARHLAEIRRVLRGDGLGYLAVPHRWMLMEPHFRLPFLSWWPRPWRTPYLRLLRKGMQYDCEPLQLRQLETMLTTAGLQYQNACIEELCEAHDVEQPCLLAARVLRRMLDAPLRPFLRVLILVCWLQSLPA